MTQTEWLDSNTFHCQRLRARITPAQCEANRNRMPDKGSFLGDMVFYRPRGCEGCTDYLRLAVVPVRETAEIAA